MPAFSTFFSTVRPARQWLAALLLLAAGSAAAQTPLKSLNYLYSISGKKTIGGIHNKEPLNEPTFYTDKLQFATGKYAGLWGGDFLFQEYNNRWQMILEAEKQWQQGALVTLTWHACNPAQNVSPCQFSGGVTSTMSDADWTALVTEGTVLNTRWKTWLDELVPYFQYLKSRGVEVAFRPLHETNQSAFWWGGRPGANGSRKLYQITHDYLRNTKGLSNIVWVWNIQDFPTLPADVTDYSPGADYFDVASLDFYNGDGLTAAKYEAMLAVAAGKPIAIGELGQLPTAAQLLAQPKWTYFMGWSELVFSQNSPAQLQALYSAANVLTREEMPGWNAATPNAGNLAYQRPVTVSSTEAPNEARFAVDGDPTTRWSSFYADPQELVVDLGATYLLSYLTILWETALGKDFELLASTDQTTWTSLRKVAGNTSLFNEYTDLNASARYLKLRGTARGTAYGFSIRELAVYGSVATAAAEATDPALRVQAYPNPATDQLTVALGAAWPAATQLTLLTSTGQTVATFAGSGSTRRLPLASLRAGLYLLRVQSAQRVHTLKITKQ
ncbi:discoidin domain-containing protein [Hymenobacter sp. J193]|uniref:glycosyl hydrolase n=1 Tax=Hymenobacter sp. J193 TaxID=2898429 RepID=UPI0021513D44|nr:glycosyl hydrolase [Hymenobacter sp. J193]MCR5890896.1 discoidin domain-containing protein [Hymenobacter sp. J193]